MPTYIQKIIDSDLTPFADFNKEMSVGSGVDTSIVVSGLMIAESQYLGFITPSGTPNSNSWEAYGYWTVEIQVDVGNVLVSARVACAKIGPSGNILQLGNYTPGKTLNVSKTFMPNVPIWDDSEESLENRLGIVVALKSNFVPNQSVTIGLGTTANEVITNVAENIDASGINASGTLFIHGHTTLADDQSLYFGERTVDRVSRSDLNGSSIEEILSDTFESPIDIKYNPNDKKIYVTYGWELPSLIERASLDGSNRETLLAISGIHTWGLALDPGAGKMYWADRTDNKLYRANIEIPNGETYSTRTDAEVLVSGLDVPAFVAIDLINNKLYFTEEGDTETISRCDLDGSDLEVLASSGGGVMYAPRGIVLDVPNNKVYWGDIGGTVFQTPKIERADLNGDNRETIVPKAHLDKPMCLAIDLLNHHLYWSDYGLATIKRCDLDGSNIETIIAGLNLPVALGIVPYVHEMDLYTAGHEDIQTDIDLLTIGHQPLISGIDLFIYGKDTASSDIDLFEHGHQPLNSSGTLLLIGHESDDANATLFVWGHQPKPSNITLYIGPSEPSDDGVSLLIHGHQPIQSGIDLSINGHLVQTSGIDLFIHGRQVLPSSVELFIHGHEPLTSSIDLLTIGHQPLTSGIDLFINGHIVQSSGIDLFVDGHKVLTSDITLFVHGHESLTADIDLLLVGHQPINASGTALIIGHEPDSSGLSLFMATKDSLSSSATLYIGPSEEDVAGANLFVHGHQPHQNDTTLLINGHLVNTSAIDLFIHGHKVMPSSISLFVHGKQDIVDDIDLFIDGHLVLASDIELFVYGKDNIANNIALLVVGHQPINNSETLVIIGHEPDASDIDLFMATKDSISSSATLYIGPSEPSDDGVLLSIHGHEDIQTDIDLLVGGHLPEASGLQLFEYGRDTITSNITLVVHGDQPILSGVELITIGHQPIVSDIDMFIHGHIVNLGDIDLLIYGHQPLDENDTLFIHGHSPQTSGLTLFEHGHETLSSAIDLFEHGKDTISSSITLTMGTHEDEEEAQTLFVHGHEAKTSDIDLFINGHRIETSGLDLILHGHLPKPSDIDLYIYGKDIIDSSISLMIGPHEDSGDTGTLFIHGHEVEVSDLVLFINGHRIETSSLDLILHGHAVESSDIDLHLHGYQPTTSDSILFIHGHETSLAALTQFINGHEPEGSAPSLFIRGCETPTSDIELHVHGHQSLIDDTTLFVDGHESIEPEPASLPTLFTHGHLASVNTIVFGALQDATITSNTPDTKRGLEQTLIVGADASGINRTLVDFDIAVIPSGSTVVEAHIETEGLVDASGATEFRTYPITNSWLEAEVTWNERASGVAWAASGADFDIGTFDSWSVGTTSGITKTDIVATNVIQEAVSQGSGIVRLLLKEHVEASVVTTWASIQNPLGGPVLVVKFSTPQPDIALHIGDGHEPVVSSIDLFMHGKDRIDSDSTLYMFTEGIIDDDAALFTIGHETIASGLDMFLHVPMSGGLTLIVNGYEPQEPLSCPTLDPLAAIQIGDDLITTYQSYIDAIINQLGKNVVLEFAPIETDCPNCELDPIKRRSTGVYTPGGPEPFKRGRRCPYCKGKGVLEEKVQKCIKALLKWNPREAETFGMSLQDTRGIVRIKTYFEHIEDLKTAQHAIVHYDIMDRIKLKVKLVKGPRPQGLREDRYCVSFWTLVDD